MLVFVFLTVQMIIFATFAFSEDIQEKLNAKTVLNLVVQHAMYAGLILIIFVGFIQTYTTTPLAKRIFLNCIKITEKIQQDFCHFVNYKPIRRKVINYFVFIIIFIFCSQLFMHSVESFFKEKTTFLRTCFAIFPLIFLHTTAFKFVFYVSLVNNQLEIVGKLIPELISVEPKVFNRLGFYVKPVKSNKSFEIMKNIKNIREIFNVICENTELINRSMGITVLSIIAVMVVAITASGISQSKK